MTVKQFSINIWQVSESQVNRHIVSPDLSELVVFLSVL